MTSYTPQSNPWKNIPLVGTLIDGIQNYLTTGISADFGNVSAGTSGTLSSRPTASAASGKFYYATDQEVLYFSDGTNWHRQGLPAGSTTTLIGAGATVPTGWVAYDGSNLPASTGIYADLFAHLGNSLITPDTRGRMLVNKGTHADVATLGENDGLAVGSRRPKHKHTVNDLGHNHTQNPHAHGVNDSGHSHLDVDSGVSIASGTNFFGPAFNSANSGHTSTSTTGISIQNATPTNNSASTGVTIGPQTGAEPTDGAAYIVGLLIAKL